MKVGIFYFRSLYSQSASSLSVGKFSDYLLSKGYNVKLGVLKNDDYANNRNQLKTIIDNDIIIYKTNYKDFEYGIRFFKGIKEFYKNKKIYLIGPFANLNQKRIKAKYDFIEDIVNMQDINVIDKVFPIIGEPIKKDTIIYGVDREIEYLENGKYINLEASTGCIYNCSFCHVNILKYKNETVDVDWLVNEIDLLVNKMHKKYLIFNDSVFWKDEKDTERINQIVYKIKQRNIKFYFMIYLSLTSKIPVELLDKLKEIGLIRVFFGVENISKNFQTSNNKYVSEKETKNFIKLLEDRNITYHIGFILFSYETKYEELLINLQFLKDIKKLFRPGIIVEKMRILPHSKNEDILYECNDKIDQAYNYKIKDDKVQKAYELTNEFFANINIRNFEHFFTSINLAIGIIKRENIEKEFIKEANYYYEVLNHINTEIYNILKMMYTNLEYSNEDLLRILDLYSESEIMYITFTKKLRDIAPDIFMILPHGKEDLNI